MKKQVLKMLGLILLVVLLNTTNSYADTVIKEMTNSADYKQINYGIVEKETSTIKKSDSTASSIYNRLNSGHAYDLYNYQVAYSPFVFCNQRQAKLEADCPYYKNNNVEWQNRADVKWILAAVATGKLGNSGNNTDFGNLPGQIALWWLHPNESDGSMIKGAAPYKIAMEAKAYADYEQKRQNLEKSSGNDYKYVSVIQTEPKNERGLVGPYKIDYIYGEHKVDNEEYYVSGISEMILKNEKGQIIKHIGEKTNNNDTYWYIADKNGNRINNGAYGNKPKPNQEFYIKLVNFTGAKGYMAFKMQKVEINAEYITANGKQTKYIQGVLCENCWATRTKWLWSNNLGRKLER